MHLLKDCLLQTHMKSYIHLVYIKRMENCDDVMRDMFTHDGLRPTQSDELGALSLGKIASSFHQNHIKATYFTTSEAVYFMVKKSYMCVACACQMRLALR